MGVPAPALPMQSRAAMVVIDHNQGPRPAMKCPACQRCELPLRKRLMASVVVLTELNHMPWPGAAVPALASASIARKPYRSLPSTPDGPGGGAGRQVICS